MVILISYCIQRLWNIYSDIFCEYFRMQALKKKKKKQSKLKVIKVLLSCKSSPPLQLGWTLVFIWKNLLFINYHNNSFSIENLQDENFQLGWKLVLIWIRELVFHQLSYLYSFCIENFQGGKLVMRCCYNQKIPIHQILLYSDNTNGAQLCFFLFQIHKEPSAAAQKKIWSSFVCSPNKRRSHQGRCQKCIKSWKLSNSTFF